MVDIKNPTELIEFRFLDVGTREVKQLTHTLLELNKSGFVGHDFNNNKQVIILSETWCMIIIIYPFNASGKVSGFALFRM